MALYVCHMVYAERRDGLSRMMKFLFTREEDQLIIIPTDHQESVKFWQVSYAPVYLLVHVLHSHVGPIHALIHVSNQCIQ